MTVLDPSGVQLLVKITEANGGQAHVMWTRSSDQSGGSNEVSGSTDNIDLAVVEQVEIELNLGNNGKVSVTVAAPFDLGIRLMKTRLFMIGNTIEVQIGYPKIGRYTPWFSGFTSKPAVRMSPGDGLTATLIGQGGAFAALRSSSNQVYTGQSYRQIIETVADRHRWTVRFPRVDAEAPLDTSRATVSQGGHTDWGFIQQITRQANCDAFMAPDRENIGRSQIVVRSRAEDNRDTPVRTYMVSGNADFENVYPILDFESSSEGVWAPRSASMTRSSDMDPDSKKRVVVEATPETSNVTSLNSAVAVGTGSSVVGDHNSQMTAERRTDLDQGEYLHVSQSDRSRTPTEVIESHREESAMRSAIKAQVTTIGIPEQFAAEIVGVRGIGVFDGNYRVLGLTHRVMSGEWTMVLNLQNNATSTDLVADHFSIIPESTNEEESPVARTDNAGSGASTEVEPEEAE